MRSLSPIALGLVDKAPLDGRGNYGPCYRFV